MWSGVARPSGLPEWLRNVHLLEMGVFQEIRVGLEIAVRAALVNLRWSCGHGRRPGRGVAPKSAMFEDLADHVFLAGLDEGNSPYASS